MINSVDVGASSLMPDRPLSYIWTPRTVHFDQRPSTLDLYGNQSEVYLRVKLPVTKKVGSFSKIDLFISSKLI